MADNEIFGGVVESPTLAKQIIWSHLIICIYEHKKKSRLTLAQIAEAMLTFYGLPKSERLLSSYLIGLRFSVDMFHETEAYHVDEHIFTLAQRYEEFVNKLSVLNKSVIKSYVEEFASFMTKEGLMEVYLQKAMTATVFNKAKHGILDTRSSKQVAKDSEDKYEAELKGVYEDDYESESDTDDAQLSFESMTENLEKALRWKLLQLFALAYTRQGYDRPAVCVGVLSEGMGWGTNERLNPSYGACCHHLVDDVPAGSPHGGN